jgi:hypothetical protein
MAEGIRIRHQDHTLETCEVCRWRAEPTGDSLVIAVRDLTEPLGVPPPPYVPPACALCNLPEPGHALIDADGRFERYKMRHVTIDTEGYGLVSAGVYDGLKHLGDHGGFDLTNTITNPPTQRIDMNANGSGPAVSVLHKMQRPITDQLIHN